MNFNKTLLSASLALCSALVGAQTSSNSQPTPGAASGMPLTATQQQSMVKLQQAADRLRDAVAAMRGKQSTADRERAIAQTQDALHATQRAMRELPAEIRNAPAAAITPAQYEASVEATMRAAESLRQSIQAMAKLPAGAARNDAIAQANQALIETHAATMAAYGAGTSSKTSRAASSSATGGDRQSQAVMPPAAVLVLLPAAQGNDQKLANGCWVRFYDDTGYKGAALTLAGPVDLPKMELGNVWRDWDSAVVGPNATVTTYDNENFRERTAVLRQGQSVPNLREKQLGWFEEVKSARVSCVS